MATNAGTRYVALLRGVNVGGKNKLPMTSLSALFEAAGARDVATYIQSGNVVFAAAPARGETIARAVEEAITREHGFRAPIAVRSAAAMARVVANNPYLPAEPPTSLHVGFLSRTPDAAAVARLDPARSPGDRFEVRGAEVYLCLPSGVARTKLTNAYFDARLDAVTTVRNWATVVELARRTG